MEQTLITACQMFLVPSTIMFAALGVAPTEYLKTLVSAMGVTTSGLWFFRLWHWDKIATIDSRVTLMLSGALLVAWIICLGAHARLAYQERFGKKPYEPVTQ